MKGKIFLAVFVCLFAFGGAFAQSYSTINESETRIDFRDKAADILLVVENPEKSFQSQIKFEILDVKGNIRSTFVRREKIKSGKETYKISAPLLDLMEKNPDEIGWFRLHYQIADESQMKRSEGTISFSETLKDVFELRVVFSENVFAGMNFRARVRAVHPFSNEPVKNVKITGEIALELETEDTDKNLKITGKGETDAEGFCLLEFKVPPNARLDYDGDMKIVGTKYGIEREVEEDLRAATESLAVYLNADKPLYQPGQSFNVRGLLMRAGVGTNTIVSDTELEFVIKDEEDTVLYRESVKTSRFGIASIAWQIPENAKLGTYQVEAKFNEDESGYENFKVSRYDLPNFTVITKADRDFYLLQNEFAEVEIRADYLFGKPVAKGTVKIVQESDRKWNYREQKWDIEEVKSFTGETDADGKFKAKIDLRAEHLDLALSGYRRYKDINFAAYFTDATTNRTEQKRFDLRLSKESIHVYLIGENYNRNPFLPQTFYLSTFYADGTPAVCDVEVKGGLENESNFNEIARLKTNRYGAGKLQFNAPRRENYDKDLIIKITAADAQKQFGTFEENVDFDTDDAIKIEPEKTIYKSNETIKASIISTQKDALVYVDVVRNWSTVVSETVRLKDGRADVKIPYKPEFKGDLSLAAYFEKTDEDGDTDLITNSRGVIFPAPNNLKLDAKFSQTIYRPNEEARINFDVLTADKKPLESALGIIVFDKAIEERARTDAEFGGSLNLFDTFNNLLGYDDSFGSLTRRDLDETDLSKPVSADLQLAAELMFYDNYFYPQISRSRETGQAQNVFAAYFKKQIAPVETALKNAYLNDSEHPTDNATLLKILDKNSINFNDLRDPWAMNYRVVFEIEQKNDLLRFVRRR